MSMMDKLKGLVGKSPDKAPQSTDKATSAADQPTGGTDGDTLGQAEEKAQGYGDTPSEQDGPEPDGHGGGSRQ